MIDFFNFYILIIVALFSYEAYRDMHKRIVSYPVGLLILGILLVFNWDLVSVLMLIILWLVNGLICRFGGYAEGDVEYSTAYCFIVMLLGANLSWLFLPVGFVLVYQYFFRNKNAPYVTCLWVSLMILLIYSGV